MTPQELKNSILQLAIQGKLVEQRPEEGTAAELLEKILATKNAKTTKVGSRVPRDRNGRAVAPRPPIPDDEKPFDIPESWEWVRLGDCVSNRAGLAYSKGNLDVHSGKMIRVLRGGNIVDMGYCTKPDDVMISTEFVNSDLFLRRNVLITPAVTSLDHVGKMGRIEEDHDDMVVGGFVLMLTPHLNDDVFSRYLLCACSSKHFRDCCRNIVNKSGQAFYNLSRTKMMELLIPLPPLAEQKRIVAKIEELLPLIDRYEKAWSKLEDFNKRFPVDMQKSLLQMAIQGKLVEQRPEEGTGEELYCQIQAEKQRLVKSGKIKKEKSLPEITEDEIPFDIPGSWKWTKLGEISWFFDAGKSPSCLKQPVKDKEWGVITTTSIQIGFFDETQNKVLPNGFSVNKSMQVRPKDILITRAGPMSRTGVACLVRAIRHNLILSDKTVRINMTDSNVYKDFIVKVLNSPQIRQFIINLMSGMDKQQVNISQEKFKTVLIPLPPLAEQKRIVAKLEEILPLCERLK